MDILVEVDVRGIFFHAPEGDPVLLLHSPEADRLIPIWLSPADSMKFVDGAGDSVRRPGGAEALTDLVERLGGTIDRMEITGCHEGVFIASLIIANVGDGDEIDLDMRVSEAVAVCAETEAPILIDQQIIDTVSVPASAFENRDDDVAEGEAQQQSVDEFMQFLDSVDAADFLTPPDSPDNGEGPERS